jgi:phosphate:Na+ symporter
VEYGIAEVLTLLGSLGIFLFGMKLMSESLQKVAGEKMRSILEAMTSNRFKGILTGLLITAVIQSSSATTVMVVSFVNAGLLSLIESIGVIMGANIGTTITAWLISILGFKVKMSALAIPLIGLGFPLIFSKNTNRKSWGEMIIGFSLLFIGLQYLKEAVPDIKSNPEVLNFLGNYIHMGYFSLLLFLFIGTILTVVIQSSSATMALTLVLCFNGIIPFEIAAAMVLGENIGTTITANLAALVANVSAKRAARAHFIFNIFGVIWILLLFYPFIKLINWFIIETGGQSPDTTSAAIPVALSIFHSGFNVANVLIMAWFAPFIEKVVVKLVPDKDTDEEFRLKHINVGTVSTSELSILQARKEITVYAERVSNMFGFVKKLYEADKDKKFDKWLKKIEKYEEISDRMEVEIASYLTKIAESELSGLGTKRIRAMLEIIDDIESIADLCYNISKTLQRKRNGKNEFPEKITENIRKMFSLVDEALEEMIINLSEEYSDVDPSKSLMIEEKINSYRNQLREEHIANVKASKYKYKTGVIYNELFSVSEKLADYIVNVTEAINQAKN